MNETGQAISPEWPDDPVYDIKGSFNTMMTGMKTKKVLLTKQVHSRHHSDKQQL